MDQGSRPERKTRRSQLERRFEAFLWHSRLMVLMAVVPALLGALVLFIIASLDILSVLADTWRHYAVGGPDIHKSVVTDIIVAVDIYLIALVLMIFGLGVYKLFVSRIEPVEGRDPQHPFNVRSLDQLKDKIARVVILAVIIEFFRAVVGISFDTPQDAIYLALSVLALALALYLMALAHKQE
ncbi:MAG: YqhA family protein [Halomonas sp.]|uniref:YqhA family protein n=1 Tax=Halomonas sp. TaxID=1486246 RepID=UPI00286FE2AC|nr:YqhA family protein [Halomonas sp.]MDR9439056.1 YqhA family protein [Halomonas sp.]